MKFVWKIFLPGDISQFCRTFVSRMEKVFYGIKVHWNKWFMEQNIMSWASLLSWLMIGLCSYMMINDQVKQYESKENRMILFSVSKYQWGYSIKSRFLTNVSYRVLILVSRYVHTFACARIAVHLFPIAITRIRRSDHRLTRLSRAVASFSSFQQLQIVNVLTAFRTVVAA